jgi:hypothetical protein
MFNTTSANGTHLWVERSRFRPRRQAWAIHLSNQDGKIIATCERHSEIMPTIRKWNDDESRRAEIWAKVEARIARAKEMGDI